MPNVHTFRSVQHLGIWSF